MPSPLGHLPTAENPNPTSKLGYELKQTKPKQTLFRKTFTKKLKKLPANSASAQSTNHRTATKSDAAFMSPRQSPSLSCPNFSSPVSEHCYCTRSNPINCESCDYKDVLINSYKKKLEQLARQNRLLKRAKLLMKSKHISFSWAFTKADKNELLYWSIIN